MNELNALIKLLAKNQANCTPIERAICEFYFDGLLLPEVKATASAAAAELARLQAIEKAARELVEYRKHNTLNFQLEKADYFIREMQNNLKGE
jgi:hypothetical protein